MVLSRQKCTPDCRRLQWVRTVFGKAWKEFRTADGRTVRAVRALCFPSHGAIASLVYFAPAVSTASTLGLNAMNSDKRPATYNPPARI
jgi:hypothetical protein